MSPRIVPKDPPIATVHLPSGEGPTPPDILVAERQRDADFLDSLAKGREDPYAPGSPFSYYRDLLTIEDARVREHGTFKAPRYGLGDPGPEPGSEVFGAPTVQEAQRRLARTSKRDITSSTGSVPDLLRPSLPGPLQEIWGKAARRVSGLVDALPRIPLEAGMVDNSGTQAVVRIPALATGAAVAVQAEDAAVQETDPTSAGIAAPLGSIAGQVDSSRQLVEFSKPSIDEVLTEDLSARLAEALDAQVFNGVGSGGALKGFLQTSGVISITGVVTNAGTYLQSLLQAFSQLAGASGYGSADRDEVLVALHPRRYSWLQAGFSFPVEQLLPGRLVLVPNAPSNLGAGTNEDHSLVIERSAVTLVGGQPKIRVFEEVGSANQEIRFSAHADAALVIGNAKAVARVTGGTPPSGF